MDSTVQAPFILGVVLRNIPSVVGRCLCRRFLKRVLVRVS